MTNRNTNWRAGDKAVCIIPKSYWELGHELDAAYKLPDIEDIVCVEEVVDHNKIRLVGFPLICKNGKRGFFTTDAFYKLHPKGVKY